MNKPQTDPAALSSSNIGDVRTQIDAIDSQLAALIAHRCGLSASVAAAKRVAGDAAFGWRPTREVEILRSVMRQQASLDPELAFSIWRALISVNLAAQGDLKILTVREALSQAQAAFNVGTRPQVMATKRAVLQALVVDDHAIGVLPWPSEQSWWVTMMEPAFNGLYVCAATPLLGGDPDALLIAKRLPEAAGEDISLVAGPAGAVDGGVIAQINDQSLMACGEFIDPDTPLPVGCRLIGSFALA